MGCSCRTFRKGTSSGPRVFPLRNPKPELHPSRLGGTPRGFPSPALGSTPTIKTSGGVRVSAVIFSPLPVLCCKRQSL
jgi:hypothetical protein